MTLRYNLRIGQSTYRNSDPVSADTAVMCIYSHIKNLASCEILLGCFAEISEYVNQPTRAAIHE